jgi:hypothetical protein
LKSLTDGVDIPDSSEYNAGRSILAISGMADSGFAEKNTEKRFPDYRWSRN